MTQLNTFARAVLPDPPSQGIRDFHLIILNPTATEVITQFSAYKYAGLDYEVAAAVAPGGACKTLTFSGRPELVACGDNEVVIFRLNDGGGWKDVFYGAVTEGWAAKPWRQPRQYSADADYLLNGTVTDAVAYPAQDPAFIAQDLVRRLRHPALNFNEIDFPPTGAILEGGFEQPGIPLGDALGLLAQSVEDSGRKIAHGIDGRGYVFFKQLTGTLNVTYRAEDYTDLPVKADDTVTAVLWVIGNEPSEPGWSGSYDPGTLTHLSVPDRGLHQQYGRIIGRVPSQGNLYSPDRSLIRAVVTNAFLNAPNAYDTSLDTKSIKDPSYTTGTGLFQASSSADEDSLQLVCGVRLRYYMAFDAAPAASIYIRRQLIRVNPPGQYLYVAVKYALPYTGEEWNSIDFIFPPTKPIYIDFRNLSAVYRQGSKHTVEQFGIYGPNTGNFSIVDVSFLTLNTSVLDAAARTELRTPAQNPAQLILRRGVDRDRLGYYVPPLSKVKLDGSVPDAAEYRYAFDRQNGVSTVVDLGNPAREGDAAFADRIRLAIDNATRQSEVRNSGGGL